MVRQDAEEQGSVPTLSQAKQACDMFVKQGLMTREEYLKQYFE